MVKKVREKEGGGKHPRRLRGLAFLLSVVLFLTCAFPFTAQAKTKVNVDGLSWGLTTTDFKFCGQIDKFTTGASLPGTPQGNVSYIDIAFIFRSNVPSDTDLLFSFVTTYARYKSFDCHYVIQGDVPLSTGYFRCDYSENTATTSTFDFPSIPIDFDIKSGYLILFELSNFDYGKESNKELDAGFRIYEYSFYYDSQSTGLLNSIIDFIKGIFEKLVNLPSEIGKFITNLGETISGFFSNLIGNLGSWFASIGDWFSDLGNNIKEWFNGLGDRISGFFVEIYENIRDFLISLFKPSDDYFDNLQKDLDQHMSDHLGAVYNVPKALLEHLKEIVTGLEAADGSHLIIHFPELAFKLNGERYSLFAGIDYDLLEPINSLDDSTTKSMVNVIILLMHGFIDLGLAIGAFKMIYKQIINKVGIEGGSDL